jgi:hypothetical protein
MDDFLGLGDKTGIPAVGFSVNGCKVILFKKPTQKKTVD